MSGLESLRVRVAGTGKRIAFPEAVDPRVLRAAACLAREDLVEPLLVGPAEQVRQAARREGLDPAELTVEDPATSVVGARCRGALEACLRHRDVDVAAVAAQPLYHAAALLRCGLVDGVVAGAVHATPELLRAALRVVGLAPGVRLASSFFLMELARPTAGGDDLLAFADCGLVPDPDAVQLAEIALRTASSYERLAGTAARVALLSFSTRGSADHPRVRKVREAVEHLRRSRPPFVFDGELQVDAAIVPEVGQAKAPDSPVEGRANVLIFPDLDAGNIGYKLVQRLAGARAVGPLLQGFARPINDLSRGASDDDIVAAAAVTALQASDAL